MSAGAYFDHDANGFAESTGWVDSHDGLLAWDRDSNGSIDSGRELFGNETMLQNGQLAADGFQALAEWDQNSDGKIDASDAVWANLKVWRDANSDGINESGELLSLADAGVQSINLSYGNGPGVDAQGNDARLTGSFTRTDSSTAQVTDYFFKRDTALTVADQWLAVPDDIRALPDAKAFGNVYDLRQAMVRDGSGALKTLVASFVSETAVADRQATMEAILFKWTGSEGINPASRGTNMDARRVAVLEAFTGEAWSNIYTGSQVYDLAAAQLEQAWSSLYGSIYAQLMAQTHLKDSFDKVTYRWDGEAKALKANLGEAKFGLQQLAAANPTLGAALDGEFDRAVANLFSAGQIDAVQTVHGTAGDDLLQPMAYHPGAYQFFGGGGNDTINGGGGDDVLDGGAGDDLLYGASGNDVYLFGHGRGHDTIEAYDTTPNKHDVVRFDADVAPQDVLLKRSGDNGNDLTFSLDGGDSTLTVPHYFQSGYYNAYKIEGVQFSGKPEWNGAEIKAHALIGGDGNDTITGYATDDTLIGNGGDDTLTDYYGNNTFYGGAGNDFLAGGYGDDLLYGGSGNDWIGGGPGADILDGGSGNDTLYGAEGSDTYVFGRGYGNDVISSYDTSSGKTDVVQMNADVSPGDVLLSRSGASGYDLLFSITGTQDTLAVENFFHPSQSQSYRINGVTFADGTAWDYAQIKAKALIGGEGNDTITGYASNDVLIGNGGDDTLTDYYGNNTFYGGAGNDSLSGGDGADILDGGPGNDSLYGGMGNDTFVFGRGGGQDQVLNYDWSSTRHDVIRFAADVTPGDVWVSRPGGNGHDLRLAIEGTSDAITVVSFFDNAIYQVDGAEFSDGTAWDLASLKARALIGNDDANTIYGYATDDVLIGNGGNDTLIDNYGSNVFYGGAGNDSISAGNSSGVNQLYGGAGDDTLIGGGGDDLLDGGPGNDSLYGEMGNDTFVFGRGSGQDTIANYDWSETRHDIIQLGADIAPGDVAVERISGTQDVRLSIKDTSDTVTLQGFLANNIYAIDGVRFADGTEWNQAALRAQMLIGNDDANIITGYATDDVLIGNGGNDTLTDLYGNNTFYGGAGNDTLTAGGGNDLLNGGAGDDYLIGGGGADVLDGGPGNDTLIGGAGNDTYVFGRGSGQDTIYNNDVSENRHDIVQFGADVAPGDVYVERITGTNHIRLSIKGTSDTVTVPDFFYDNIYAIDGVRFADGTEWNKAELTERTGYVSGTSGADVLAGSAAANVVQGLAGNDSITTGDVGSVVDGGAGNDTVTGGPGNNLLAGGTGNDTIHTGSGHNVIAFNKGGGTDSVGSDAGASNSVSLGNGIRYNDLSLSKDGNDLVLNTGGDDKLTFKDWYGGKDNVLRLQMILDASNDFDANSSDPLYNKRVETFDFRGIVSQFDQALAASPGLTNWAVTNALLDFHLSGSDDEALGGDLAYWYGKNNGFTGISLAAAQQAIGAQGFGADAQSLHAFNGLLEGLVKLA